MMKNLFSQLFFRTSLLIFSVLLLSVIYGVRPASAETPTSTTTACYVFTQNLTVGSSGADVVALQNFLVSKGYLFAPSGTDLGYFGSLTKAALAAYQVAKGISPAEGYFGVITRASVNADCASIPTTEPTICATDLQMVWSVGSGVPYSVQTDSCSGYRYLVGKEVSPACYSQSQCAALSGGSCVNIAEAKSQCTVSSSSITILSPNGGETLLDKSVYKIKWSSTNVTSKNVNIWLLDDPTRLGQIIIPNVINDGTEDWTVSPLNSLWDAKNSKAVNPSGKYVIWMECADQNCIVDDSNSYFTISSATTTIPSITVTSPKGDDVFVEGTNTNITWNTNGVPSSQGLDIVLNVGSGGTGQAIAQNVANTGSYSWTVKSLQPFYASEANKTIYPTGQYNIYVACPYGSTNCNFSPNFGQSGVFTISSATTTAGSSDSDGGKNYFVKGTTIGITKCTNQSQCMTPTTSVDVCWKDNHEGASGNDNQLHEYYIESDGYKYVEFYQSSTGCENGAAKVATTTCTTQSSLNDLNVQKSSLEAQITDTNSKIYSSATLAEYKLVVDKSYAVYKKSPIPKYKLGYDSAFKAYKSLVVSNTTNNATLAKLQSDLAVVTTSITSASQNMCPSNTASVGSIWARFLKFLGF